MSSQVGAELNRWLSAIRSSVVGLVFLSVLFVFTLTLTYYSFQFSEEARIFPLIVAIVIIPLMVALFLQTGERITGAAVLPDRLSTADESDVTGPDADTVRVRTDALRLFGWVALVFVGIVLLGMELSLLAFLIAYYRIEGGQTWLRTALYSAVLWALIEVLFVFALDVPVPEGMLFHLLVG